MPGILEFGLQKKSKILFYCILKSRLMVTLDPGRAWCVGHHERVLSSRGRSEAPVSIHLPPRAHCQLDNLGIWGYGGMGAWGYGDIGTWR